LATGHLSGKLFFAGHSSGHTDSNDTGLEYLSCQRLIKRAVTHTNRIRKIYTVYTDQRREKLSTESIEKLLILIYNSFL
jgi:hypothetical protein